MKQLILKVIQWLREWQFQRTRTSTISHTRTRRIYSIDAPNRVFYNRPHAIKQPHKRYPAPPCDPGTITYRDWLVRHVGYDRRLADQMLKAWRDNPDIRLPLPNDSQTLKELL